MKIKPFRGIRPPKELAKQVSSRPYDVLESEEARVEAAGNPKSLYHIIKPEINFEPGTSEFDPKVYPAALEQFKLFRQNGWLQQDGKENYYVMLNPAAKAVTATVPTQDAAAELVVGDAKKVQYKPGKVTDKITMKGVSAAIFKVK